MTRILIRFITTSLLFIVPLCQALAKGDELPQVTAEGLHRVQDSKLAIVYADPAADLSIYDSVKILEPYVAFRKDWERKHRTSATNTFPVNARDVERMKATMAKEFNEVFTQVLTEGGYAVTDQAADNVMLIRPAIIDLDPNAPEIRSATMSKTYVQSAGEMTMYIELYDSVTGDMIAKALDRRVDRAAYYYTWANPATNAAASKKILRGWATILRDALDEARQ